MSKKIVNCRVLLHNGDGYYIDSCDIYVKNGLICDKGNVDGCIDLQGDLLLPTFFNLHSHLGESIFKDIEGRNWTLKKYLEYTELYNSSLSPKERKTEWEKSACYTAERMQENYISGFCAARSAAVASQYGMNTMSGYPIMNSPKLKNYISEGLDGFRAYYEKFSSEKNSIGVFFHSVYANDSISLELARKCMDAGAEFLTVHVAEDEESQNDEFVRWGKSAVEVLDEYGLLSEKTVLVHGGYLSTDDLEMVRKAGAMVSICPISNVFLNTRIVDVNLLEEMKIPWCIATDGLGTGRTFSLLEQVTVFRSFYPKIGVERLLDAITVSPAKYYLRQRYTGRIEVGTEAKFLRIEDKEENVEILLNELFGGSVGCKSLIF